MSDFYFKNVENNNSRRLYDITDIFNLVQSVPAWELPAKMQISAAVKLIFCWGKNCPWEINLEVPKQNKKEEEAPVLALHRIPAHIWSTFTRGCCPSQSL